MERDDALHGSCHQRLSDDQTRQESFRPGPFRERVHLRLADNSEKRSRGIASE